MRTRRLVLLEVLASTGAAWIALSGQPLTDLHVAGLTWLGMAYLLLELFEVELPRGESSTMSTPVAVVGALVLAPWEAALSVSVPAVLVHLVWRRHSPLAGRAQTVLERLLVVLAAICLVRLLTATAALSDVALAAIVAVVAVSLDFALTQLRSAERLKTPLLGLLVGGARFQGTLVAAQVTAAVLGAVVYQEMDAWAALVLAMMLMIMRQAFSLYVSVRRAYQSTIEALARTVEAVDAEKMGHSERVSSLATEVGRLVGLSSADLERLAYAALLHDLGELGERWDKGSPEPQLSAADMVGGVGFLSSVVPVLRASEDVHDWQQTSSLQDVTLAYIVLVASRTDDLARGADTISDSRLIAAVDSRVDDESKQRIEMAFRVAAQKVPGRLFAVAGPPGSQ